jgi:hypothetical protein
MTHLLNKAANDTKAENTILHNQGAGWAGQEKYTSNKARKKPNQYNFFKTNMEIPTKQK